MKANEAPKEIYLLPDDRNPNGLSICWYDAPYRTGAIEYIRTDAFIEKACAYLDSIGQENSMAQYCYASVSSTGLHCAWCVTRNILENGIELSQAFCEKHEMPCKELGYYCDDFIGFHPDYHMTDEEEMDLIEKLRNK